MDLTDRYDASIVHITWATYFKHANRLVTNTYATVELLIANEWLFS